MLDRRFDISHALIAIGFMIASMWFFSVMNVFIRFTAEDLHTTQIVFLRNLFSVALLLPWVLHHGSQILKTERMGAHFWRGTIGVAGMQLWFYCISTLPLNEATALSFTAPIFTTIIAVLFLGEHAGPRRWAAIVIGFVGALIIIRPDPDNMQWDAMIVLCATSLWAVAGILVKTLTKTEPANRIVFYMAAIMAIWSLPAALWFWQDPSTEHLWYILGVSVASTLAHICMVKAYTYADVVVVMPFDFFRLVFTAILAYVIFDELADGYTWIGGGIIVASSAYIAYRESRIKKREAA